MPGQETDRRPLSAAQLGVWYAQRLDPASPVFNQGGHVDLHGPIDVPLFAEALSRLVAEDGTTRLRFTEAGGVPAQFAAAVEPYVPEIADLRDTPDPEAAARELIDADMATVPDLEQGPLFRHLLLRLGEDRLRWYYRAHHLMQDGFSGHLLQRRLGEIYTALAGGTESGPALGPVSALLDQHDVYRDSAARKKDRAFWSRVMEGAECPPARAGRPALRIAREVSFISGEQFAALREFGVRAGVSWQQVLIGAGVLHQHRRTGARDVLLSLPVTGRLTPAARRVPGMSANVLPLRVAVDPDATCAALMARVASAVLRVQWHQRYDASELIRDLGWPADGRRQFGPVVNVLAGDAPPTFGGVPGTAHLLSTGGTAEDLGITVTDGPDGGLRVDFTVDAAYADSVPLASHRRSFHRVLDTLTGDADVPVREVDVLDGVEWGLVVEEWNNTAVPIGQETLNTLFEHQARIHPDHTAVIFNDEHTTYRRLNENANRLAHHLTHCAGIRRGDLIGVLHDRSTTFATTLIALTKTGAAYTVLDPDFPDTRLNTTLTRNHITTVITDTNHTHRITAPHLIHTDHDTHHHNHPAT
ncbi:condensation domain-containing protein, partial [Streptomyces otsuchiensis]|uniref:condensation domain-containing protein n=1 Tax=Streptomyces otsuchiensis TaxID=2681388 RepID=UPI00130062A2